MMGAASSYPESFALSTSLILAPSRQLWMKTSRFLESVPRHVSRYTKNE